jgi:hypothetical protein
MTPFDRQIFTDIYGDVAASSNSYTAIKSEDWGSKPFRNVGNFASRHGASFRRPFYYGRVNCSLRGLFFPLLLFK